MRDDESDSESGVTDYLGGDTLKVAGFRAFGELETETQIRKIEKSGSEGKGRKIKAYLKEGFRISCEGAGTEVRPSNLALPTGSIESCWAAARNVNSASAEDRISALYELYKKRAPGLDLFVSEELTRTGSRTHYEWIDALLRISEAVDFSASVDYATLSKALLTHALVRLERGDYKEPLFAALRRYGSVASVKDGKTLLPFLNKMHPQMVRQISFQCIQNMYSSEERPDFRGRKDLLSRINEIAKTCLNPEIIDSPQIASVGLNAVLAAATLGDEDLPRLIKLVVSCGDLVLVQYLNDHLQRINAFSSIDATSRKGMLLRKALEVLRVAQEKSFASNSNTTKFESR